MANTKTAQSRYQDTLEFIRLQVSGDLAQHINAVLAGHTEDDLAIDRAYDGAIGSEISLKGKKSWYYARSQDKRDALRALLLCQNVYLSDRWTRSSAIGGTWQPDDRRPPSMLKTSIEYWRQRSELEIVQAIRAFTITENADITKLVTAAQEPGDDTHQLPSLRVTRELRPFPGHPTCYTSVTHWLFRSGLVSYRWMLRNALGSVAPTQLKDVFGAGRTIWAKDTPFTTHDSLPKIPAGMIVHLYIDTPYTVGGHWLVSDGTGRAYGRNNDDEDGAANRVYALCDLNKQFLAYKGTTVGQSGKPVLQSGQADVIGPLEIPDRI